MHPAHRKVPSYCYHKASGQAVVRINSKDIYLGVYGSPASKEKYQRVIAEWLAASQQGVSTPLSRGKASTITVSELVLAYWQFVHTYYVKNGRPTSEQDNVRQALRFVVNLYGHSAAEEFSPKALKLVREAMIESGRCRNLINKDVFRIRGMFRWAAENDLLPVTVFLTLTTVKSLKKGRTNARETNAVKPAPEEHIEAVKEVVPKQIQAMIDLQLLTVMRPGEVTIIRTIDIDRSGEIWLYVPESHKTEHHEIRRVIPIGPKAQLVLEPWLRDDQPFLYLFRPLDVITARASRLSKKRKGQDQAAVLRMVKPGDCYKVSSYRQVIKRACRRLHITEWRPNQLRHNAATAIRRQFGLEAARVVLGHQAAATSEIYAEKDLALAKDIVRSVG
jgi:integrase